MCKTATNITKEYFLLTRTRPQHSVMSLNTASSTGRISPMTLGTFHKSQWSYLRGYRFTGRKGWPIRYRPILIFSRMSLRRRTSLFTQLQITVQGSILDKATRGAPLSLSLKLKFSRSRIFMAWTKISNIEAVFHWALTAKIITRYYDRFNSPKIGFQRQMPNSQSRTARKESKILRAQL